MKFAQTFIKHHVMTILLYILVVVFGFYSFQNLPLALMPSMEVPAAVVYATYPGAGPEDIEQQVTKKLEGAVAGLSGLDTLQSTSSENMAMLVIQFTNHTDMDQAMTDLRDKVAQVKSQLPDDASELLKAMPDSVLNYARTKAGASETWKSASPLEEYTLTYSTGKSAKDVTVIVAQWSDSDTVKKQYDELAKNLTGKELKSGDVKVSGKSTGSYTVRADGEDGKTATALWKNDTAVFEVTGSKESVLRFYEPFPL